MSQERKKTQVDNFADFKDCRRSVAPEHSSGENKHKELTERFGCITTGREQMHDQWDNVHFSLGHMTKARDKLFVPTARTKSFPSCLLCFIHFKWNRMKFRDELRNVCIALKYCMHDIGLTLERETKGDCSVLKNKQINHWGLQLLSKLSNVSHHNRTEQLWMQKCFWEPG